MLSVFTTQLLLRRVTASSISWVLTPPPACHASNSEFHFLLSFPNVNSFLRLSYVNIFLLAGPDNTKFCMLSASFVILFHRKCGAREETSADPVDSKLASALRLFNPPKIRERLTH